MTNTTRPPRRLSGESTKLWRSVLADYELEQRHEAALLAALEALDRLRQAQAQLEADGLTTADRYGGVKAQPCIVIERDSPGRVPAGHDPEAVHLGLLGRHAREKQR